MALELNSQSLSTPSLLIRKAQLLGRGLFDLRITGKHIEAIAPQLEPGRGDRIIEAGGNLLLPGLHDHHLHLFATAAARSSTVCGPPEVSDETSLRQLLESQSGIGEGWIRGIGFHDSVCPLLDRQWLDRVCPHRPVRIQHRSGMLWVLNSCALDRLRIEKGETLPSGVECDSDGKLNGRFYDLDAWLGERLERAWPSLSNLSEELARFGITGVTDAGVNNGRGVWEALSLACERGEMMQRVWVMGNEELHTLTSAQPERIDIAPEIAPDIGPDIAPDIGPDIGPEIGPEIAPEIGPLKIYLREIDLPDLDALVRRMREAHQHGRAVAVHCVTRVELHFALAALADAGALPGDRIEHASIADEYALQRLAELGITAVTQPHFIAERGDLYLKDVDAEDIPLLYRGASFLAHGVELAAGSDAPYGSTDPWAAIRAAVERRTRGGIQMGVDERLSLLQALNLFGGNPRQPGKGLRELDVGQPADLCLLDVPWECLGAELDASHVVLTVCAGKVIYER